MPEVSEAQVTQEGVSSLGYPFLWALKGSQKENRHFGGSLKKDTPKTALGRSHRKPPLESCKASTIAAESWLPSSEPVVPSRNKRPTAPEMGGANEYKFWLGHL